MVACGSIDELRSVGSEHAGHQLVIEAPDAPDGWGAGLAG